MLLEVKLYRSTTLPMNHIYKTIYNKYGLTIEQRLNRPSEVGKDGKREGNQHPYGALGK